jgi:MFS family permease
MAYGTQYSFGVFFSALLDEFGWSRASLSAAFSLYASAYSAFGFVAGRLTDRWGPRTVIALGGGFLGFGLGGMSLVREVWHPFVLYGVVAAIGMSTAYVPCTSTVVRWFVRRRGLAVGIASAGGSLGTFALPPLAQTLVERLGWRGAYVVFGAGVLLALNALALLMRRDPEALGLAPDGERVASAPREAAAAPEWTARRALRTRAFWMLFGVFAATWIPVFVPLVHLVRLARELGVDPLSASTLVSALGIAAVAGRLGMGALSDRIGRRPALALAIALQGISFTAFAAATSLPALYAAALGFGFSYGTVSALFPALVGDVFGREQSGTLVGLLFALAASTAGLGPVGAGWVYDRYGSYGPAWWMAAGFNALSLLLLAAARPPASVAVPPRAR